MVLCFDHVEDVVEDTGIRIHSFQPLLALPVLLHLRSKPIKTLYFTQTIISY